MKIVHRVVLFMRINIEVCTTTYTENITRKYFRQIILGIQRRESFFLHAGRDFTTPFINNYYNSAMHWYRPSR